MTPLPDRRRVVVTGLGAVTPLGIGAGTLHDRWTAGTVGIVDGFGRCTDFEPGEHLSVKEGRRLDRFSQFALVAAGEALAQAGWLGGLPIDSFRIACVIATGIGGQSTIETQLEVMRERGARQVSPLGVPQYMPNAAAAAITMKHGLQGPSYQIGSACASGGHGIGEALRMIQWGDADAAVYVNAHGTSTELNDAAETAALKLALGPEAHRVPISSTKSTIGHLLGAAGAVEAVATIQALRAGTIPPTLGLQEPDPELDLDYVPGVARPLSVPDGGPPLALSNSFAFGGHNVALAIRGVTA